MHAIEIVSVQTGEWKVLIEDGRYPRYVPTGHIVHSRFGDPTLVAVPFDVDELAVTGPAVPLIENVYSQWVLSKDGTLVYGHSASTRSLVWVNRRGEERSLGSPEHPYYMVRISPDGTKVALNYAASSGLWVYEMARQSLTRLFYRNGDDMMRVPLETSPSFAPGKPEILFSGNYFAFSARAYDISPDGERFLMVKPDDDENTELNVVLNWFDELKRLAPTN